MTDEKKPFLSEEDDYHQSRLDTYLSEGINYTANTLKKADYGDLVQLASDSFFAGVNSANARIAELEHTIQTYADIFKPDIKQAAEENIKLLNKVVQLEKELDEILGLHQSWTLQQVLGVLIEGADILMHKKNYDGWGYEEIELCMNRAKEINELINEQFKARK